MSEEAENIDGAPAPSAGMQVSPAPSESDGEDSVGKPVNKRGATRRPAPSTWGEQLRQKEREERQLQKKMERLRKEAETLKRLEEVQREAEMLMGSLGACPTPSEGSDSLFLRPLSSVPDCDDYSDCGSDQSNSQEDIPQNASEYASDRSIGHKDGSMTKRRVPGTDNFTRHDLDVESQSSRNKRGSSSGGRSLQVGGARRISVSPRELASKIMAAILTDLNDETLRREDTQRILILITLIKEAIFGIFIAFAIVSLCLFLDHIFLLKLPTARNFRRATAKLMTDQETLLSLEESGLKVVDLTYYNSMTEEIDKAKNKARLASDILRTRSEELEGLEAQREQCREESPGLLATLELDKFCEKCMWSQSKRVTCLDRVDALKKVYRSFRYTAMVSAMSRSSCKRQTKEEMTTEEGKKQEQEQEILDSWGKHRDDFCGDCDWEEETTCQERINYLHSRWEVPWNKAKAAAMVESKKCRYSNNKEEESKLKRFCPECNWGNKLSCLQRVKYLMYTYKTPERRAKLDALKKPSCLAN